MSADGSGSRAPNTPFRLDFVDGMRALAALYVVFVHLFYEPSLGFYTHRWMYFFGVSYHSIPVDVFIVLSGFCLMLPIARRPSQPVLWKTWYARRALRILVPCYAAVLLSAALSVFVINPVAASERMYLRGSVPAGTFWVYLLQLQDVFIARYSTAIHNAPLWSIAVECKVYLFMPAILWSLTVLGNLPTLLWTTAFGLVVPALFRVGAASPWYVALFTMGAIAAKEAARGAVSRHWLPGSALFVAVFGALVAWKRTSFYNDHVAYFGLLTGGATSLFLGATMRGLAMGKRGPLVRVLESKPLVSIGLFSYSLYLVHNPLIAVVHLALSPFLALSSEGMFGVLLCTTPIYVAAAYAFYRLVERPSLLLVRSAGGAPHAEPASASATVEPAALTDPLSATDLQR